MAASVGGSAGKTQAELLGTFNNSLFKEIRDNKVERAAENIERKANVNWFKPGRAPKEKEDGRTPLQHAAEHGYVKMCELLLDHGAHVHAMNGRAFHLACVRGRKEVVELLCARGEMSKYAGKELHRMSMASSTPLQALVDLLLQVCFDYVAVRWERIQELAFHADIEKEHTLTPPGTQKFQAVDVAKQKLMAQLDAFKPAQSSSSPRAVEAVITRMLLTTLSSRGEASSFAVKQGNSLEVSLQKHMRLHGAAVTGFVYDIIETYKVAVEAWEQLKRKKRATALMQQAVEKHLLALEPLVYEALKTLVRLLDPPQGK